MASKPDIKQIVRDTARKIVEWAKSGGGMMITLPSEVRDGNAFLPWRIEWPSMDDDVQPDVVVENKVLSDAAECVIDNATYRVGYKGPRVMRLRPDMKVVCICRGGQVRSVAARHILADRYGFRKVIVCGFEKNDAETVAMLCEWADAVLVVGSAWKWIREGLSIPLEKTHFLDIGPDVYGRYNHPELLGLLTPRLEAMMAETLFKLDTEVPPS